MPKVTLRARRVACNNSKWTAYFDHVVAHNGVEVVDYLTLKSKAAGDNLISGVTVLPILDDGRLLLQRNYRHALETFCWEAVRGFIDKGERPIDAALRELTEETGHTCTPTDLVPLGHVAPEASTIAGRGALFAAKQCQPTGPSDQSEPGLGDVHAFTRTELDEMLAKSEIEDSTTLVTLYRYYAIVEAGSKSWLPPEDKRTHLELLRPIQVHPLPMILVA